MPQSSTLTNNNEEGFLDQIQELLRKQIYSSIPVRIAKNVYVDQDKLDETIGTLKGLFAKRNDPIYGKPVDNLLLYLYQVVNDQILSPILYPDFSLFKDIVQDIRLFAKYEIDRDVQIILKNVLKKQDEKVIFEPITKFQGQTLDFYR